ncbi:hypothetical protein C2S53_016212 [Perilla frutescens var. hirtella]|uniref:Uncharacterized protein n=1 Tax=Perilla frutescens var. hirtella TaxID=608512 RepID=A0AAD4IMF4_PERFH|nr:hypothetical protein C2S53_016212 [Perilla frutescens var. hirtella]
MSRSYRGVRGPMDRFVNDKGNDENADGNMTPANAKELRNQVCLDIGKFFYENGIPFNCARSASFTNMVRSIGNYGQGFKAPTMCELRTWILNEEEKTTVAFVDDIKATWKKIGVSLLSDEIKTGLYKCMERLITDQNIFMKVDEQLDSYKYKKGLFSFKASMQSFMTRPPVNPNEEDDEENENVEEESSRALSKRKRNESSSTGKGKSVDRGLFDEEDEFEEESGSGSDHGDEPNYDDFDY